MSETKVIDIKELKFDEHNFNRHNDEGMSLLEKSIKENGLGRSILLDKDNNIVGGNGVTEKAIELGKTKVRIIETDGTELIAVKRTDLTLDSEQGRKMALADNSVAHANLEWNEEELQKAQDEWGLVPEEWGVEMPDFGLPDEQDVKSTVKEDNFEIEDNIEKKVNVGDIWQLGNHRLMCGDSTNADNVAKLMNGQRADIAFTSPPYNAGKSAELAGNMHERKSKYKNSEDNLSNYDELLFLSTQNNIDFAKYAFINIQMLAGNKIVFCDFVEKFKNQLCDIAIWNKSNAAPAMARRVMNSQFEFIFIFSKDNPSRAVGTRDFHGDISNVNNMNSQHNNEYAAIHAATFSVEFAGYYIGNFSNQGEIILDTFGGTGTTMIAAEQLGRKCYMMELDPYYCDVIIARWEKLTGGKAVRLNE